MYLLSLFYSTSCWKYQHQTTFPVIHKYKCCTLHKICTELTAALPINTYAIKNIPALVIALSSADIAGFTMHCICMESGQVSYRDKISLFNTTTKGSFACSCLYLQLFPSPLTSLWSDHWGHLQSYKGREAVVADLPYVSGNQPGAFVALWKQWSELLNLLLKFTINILHNSSFGRCSNTWWQWLMWSVCMETKMQYVSNSGCVSTVPSPNIPQEGKTLTKIITIRLHTSIPIQ